MPCVSQPSQRVCNAKEEEEADQSMRVQRLEEDEDQHTGKKGGRDDDDDDEEEEIFKREKIRNWRNSLLSHSPPLPP